MRGCLHPRGAAEAQLGEVFPKHTASPPRSCVKPRRVLLSAEFGPACFLRQGSPAEFTSKDTAPKKISSLLPPVRGARGTLVVPGSHLSAEQPQFSPLFPPEPPQLLRSGALQESCDSSSGWGLCSSLGIQLIPLNKISHGQERWVAGELA